MKEDDERGLGEKRRRSSPTSFFVRPHSTDRGPGTLTGITEFFWKFFFLPE